MAPLVAALIDHRPLQTHLHVFHSGTAPHLLSVAARADAATDVTLLSQQDFIQVVVAAKLHVLIDATGFTSGNQNRLLFGAIASHRLAPVQVSWAGTPSSIGLPGVYNYLVSDVSTLPPRRAQDYVEKIIYLPGTWLFNSIKQRFPGDLRLAGLSENLMDNVNRIQGPVTHLCNLGTEWKYGEEVVQQWCKILHRVPGSKLFLIDGPLKKKGLKTNCTHNLPRHLQRTCGLEPDRLVFVPGQLRARFMLW
jgi:protein O-GlcNAc transferase